MIVLLFLPGGFSQLYYDGRDRLLRRVADRHGIHVPSLIADSRQPDPTDPTAGDDAGVAVPEPEPAPLVGAGDER